MADMQVLHLVMLTAMFRRTWLSFLKRMRMTFTFFASKIRNPVQYWKFWKPEILSLKFALLVPT